MGDGKITEKTMVPLSLVLTLVGIIAGSVFTGSMWVFSVNTRLGRIEERLGIVTKSKGLLTEASAADR